MDNGAAGFASELAGSALAAVGAEPWIPAVSGVEVRGGGGGAPDGSSVGGSGGEGGGRLERVVAWSACGEGASDGAARSGSRLYSGGRGGGGGRLFEGGGGDARRGGGGGGGSCMADAPHAKMRPSAFPCSS